MSLSPYTLFALSPECIHSQVNPKQEFASLANSQSHLEINIFDKTIKSGIITTKTINIINGDI